MNDDPSVVAQLFTAIGIKRVVYVDDRFGITRERLSALCRGRTAEQIVASAVFPGIELTEDEAVREQRLTKAIEAIKEEDLEGAFDALQAVAGNGGAQEDRLAGKVFSEILGAAADVKLLSLVEWRAQSEGLIAQVAATPTLFVFDDDLRLEGGKQDDGRRLIDQAHQRLGQYKYAYALLTHNATTDESESDLEKIIARDYPAIADHVVVIAKTRLTGEDRERFVHRLKGTLLFRLFRVLKSKLKDAASAAHNEAVAKIDSLGVDAFERIIYRSSREEGAWSPETLMRIFGVVQERGVRSRLRGDQELHGAILEIDPLCAIETGGVSKQVEETAEKLQRAEVYDTEADLNLLHLPVEFGDIFRSDGGDQYVVVAQPCDLMVRKDGRRKRDDRDERQVLALLSVGSRAKPKKGGPRVQDHEFELCHFAEGVEDVWFSQVNQAVYVPAWVLDMAVLNPEGVCSIALAQQTLPLLTLPWTKRLDIVKDRAAKVVELSDSAAIPAGENRDELLRSLLRLPLKTPFSVKIDPPDRQKDQPWQLRVGLRRIFRLREGYAAALLSQYANYMSRLDQPHDLTRLG